MMYRLRRRLNMLALSIEQLDLMLEFSAIAETRGGDLPEVMKRCTDMMNIISKIRILEYRKRVIASTPIPKNFKHGTDIHGSTGVPIAMVGMRAD